MELFADRRMCTDEERIAWFREAKFGMFIHWGIYAQLAGSWKGKEIPGIGEQIMRFAEIPVKEYREIAKDFNPVKFDADAWVKLAKEAGMRYMVITAKHHDGFAMYHSKVSPYNIIDATPFGRDPMKELAAACQKYGLKLCFYYSHKQDWEDPDGYTNEGHWDATMPRVEDQVFERYMDRKAMPQVMELLTGYGPIGLIWYDTPGDLHDYNATRFLDLVHAIQPECIVSPRVSNNPDIGDYIGYGDNVVPVEANSLPWETCATMNDTWGFKAQDHNWKSVGRLLRLLASIASKGGNYLLNVGPTKEGEIPPESVERLQAIGQWVSRNGEGIFGTKGGLLRQTPEWGAVTGKEGCLYLHVFDWKPGKLTLTGLQNQVTAAKILSTGEAIPFQQEQKGDLAVPVLTLTLPESTPEADVTVLALDVTGMPTFDETPNDIGGTVLLPGFMADMLSSNETHALQNGAPGLVENWHDTADYLQWQMNITEPGLYDVELHTFTQRHYNRFPIHWEGGHEMTIAVDGKALPFVVTDEGRTFPRDNYQWQSIRTPIGAVDFAAPGRYPITLTAQKINFEHGFGPKVHSVTLKKREQ